MENNKVLKVVLYVNFFVFAALLNSVGILIQKSQNTYGVSEVTASYLDPAKDITIAIVAFLIGSYLPKLGYKKGMQISLMAVFIGCFVMYFGNAFWSVILLFMCTGFSFAIVKVSVLALISSVVETEKQHKAMMSYIESVFMLGVVFAYLVFPMFYSDTNPNAWLNVYLFLAGLIALVFLYITFGKIEFTPVENTKTFSQEMQGMFEMMKKTLIILFVIFAFSYVMTEQGIMNWLPTFNQKVLHLDETLAAQMSVILTLSIAFGRFISGVIIKKINWYYYLSACIVLATCMIIFVLPQANQISDVQINSIKDVPMVGFVFPLIGLFLAPIYPIINSTILSATSKNMHYAIAGLLTFFSALGGTLGSVIIGYLFQYIGGDRAFYFALIPLSILFVVIYFIYQKTKYIPTVEPNLVKDLD